MKRSIFILAGAFLFIAQVAFAAKPEGSGNLKYRLSPIFESSFPLGGNVGELTVSDSDWTPDVTEIFGVGIGGGAEFGWGMGDNWEGIVGIGYTSYPGGSETYTSDEGDKMTLELEDFRVMPIYIGGRILFSNEPTKGLIPYVRGDLGGAWTDAVEGRVILNPRSDLFEAESMKSTWWKSSFRFMWDIGGGLEYRFGVGGVFVEVLSRGFTAPQSGGHFFVNDVLVDRNGTVWTPLNVRLGASYYF